LSNFDYRNSHKSSILKKNGVAKLKTSHLISVNKCYNYNIVNTTWKPFFTYTIDNFIPGTQAFYNIDANEILNETTEKDIRANELECYYSHFVSQSDIYVTLHNNHFFSSKYDFDTSINGGSYSQTLPTVSTCYDIYFPNNLDGFCWFSSIVNSLFYADDISTIFLNKTVKHMDKTLEYIKDFYDTKYETFDINDQQHLKEFSKHLIHLFTFVYCSFSILSKNQLNRIANKRKWTDIYTKVTGEYYEYIYVFIIALSSTVKSNSMSLSKLI
jgi:hypothetical protein